MIEIKYLKSKAGLDNCFELVFFLKDYIPDQFFIEMNGYAIELYFYISLFLKSGLFDGERSHCHQMIWSYHYDCMYSNIPFRMYFDEDYNFVSFSVDEENIPYREEIANHIKSLVEQKMALEMVNPKKYLWGDYF